MLLKLSKVDINSRHKSTRALFDNIDNWAWKPGKIRYRRTSYRFWWAIAGNQQKIETEIRNKESYLKTMSQKQLNNICTNFLYYALSSSLIWKAFQSSIKCCIFSNTTWSTSASSRLKILYKTKIKRLSKAGVIVPNRVSLSVQRKYIVKESMTIFKKHYLRYVFPKILHNYFRLPFRLTDRLHQFSWNNKITSIKYDLTWQYWKHWLIKT